MIKELTAPVRTSPDKDRQRSSPIGRIQSMLARRRAGTLILYTMSTLFLAVFCSIVFNALEHDTEFAIAVMGSLVGGFLGALLAAALIVDIYLPKKGKGLSDLDQDLN